MRCMTLTADVITHSSLALPNSGDVPAFIPAVHTRLNSRGLRPFWALRTSRPSRAQRGAALPNAPHRAGCGKPLQRSPRVAVLGRCRQGCESKGRAEHCAHLGVKRGGVTEGEFCSKMRVLLFFVFFLPPFHSFFCHSSSFGLAARLCSARCRGLCAVQGCGMAELRAAQPQLSPFATRSAA